MTLPVSNQFRACTSCPASIEPGDQFAHDPDGCIICVDCIPADFDHEQYEEPDDFNWDNWPTGDDGWGGDDDY